MRRDGLHLRLSDANPTPVNLSFHTSDSEEESSDRGSRTSRSGVEDFVMPFNVSTAQVCSLQYFSLSCTSVTKFANWCLSKY